MDKPTITTIDGKTHEMKALTGRTYRVIAAFRKDDLQITDVDFIEMHAALVAEFYDGVTQDDVLDMPLDEILPASKAVRDFVYAFTVHKLAAVQKNAEEDKEQSM